MSMRYPAGIVLPGYNPLKVTNAPTIGVATAGGNLCVSVAFTAPACIGGGAISSYSIFTCCGTKVTSGASSPLIMTGLTDSATYTFKVIATNVFGPSYPSGSSNSIIAILQGSAAYTTPGTYSWVAPSGVTSVSIVTVAGGAAGSRVQSCNCAAGGAGGGLGWKNNITVIPGNSYTLSVGSGGSGSNGAPGGSSSFNSTSVVSSGGSGASGGGYSGTCVFGGLGGNSGSGFSGGGGGGAGGYSGNGGNGGVSSSASGANGAGGGGGGGARDGAIALGGGGGGVGIFGQGSNGVGGVGGGGTALGGGGGSNGTSGGNSNQPAGTGGAGGVYGGGGGQNNRNTTSIVAIGGGGAVRIVWPGTSRTFPSTNVGA